MTQHQSFHGPEKYGPGKQQHVIIDVAGGPYWITFPDLGEAQRYCAKTILVEWAPRWSEQADETHSPEKALAAEQTYAACLLAYLNNEYHRVCELFSAWGEKHSYRSAEPDFFITSSLELDRPQEPLDIPALLRACPLPAADPDDRQETER